MEQQPAKTWEAAAFDREKGEWSRTTLHSYDHTIIDPDVNIEDLLVNRAAPTRITPSRRVKPERSDELTVCFGDAQIGYRGEEPFHDERALSLASLAVRELMPDRIVMTGDMIDLPAQGKYEQRHDWAMSTQRSIDRYHTFLAQLRADAPSAEIGVVHGNHELRMDTNLRKNAAELIGLRRANMEKELGVLTLQYLVRYDDLDVKSIDGWPNAAYWLNDKLKITHGTVTRKGGGSAGTYLRNEPTSTIFGHDHRLQLAHRTIPTRYGHETLVAASPGCLARLDGAVPGPFYSTNERNETVFRAPDWQQGILEIWTNEDEFDISTHRIGKMGLNLSGAWYDVPTTEVEQA